MPCRGRRGYTLLELGVVLGGVLLLTLMCLPVYHKARELARESSCNSNLKQLAQACLIYAQDYDERLPAGERGDGCESYTWRVMLYPYVRSVDHFHCPSQSLPRRMRWAGPVYPFHEFDHPAGYGCNLLHSGVPGITSPFIGAVVAGREVRVAERGLSHPASTILFADSTGSWAISAQRPSGHFGPGRLDSPTLAAKRHSGNALYAFADGHVRWRRISLVQCDSAGGEDRCPWSVE